MAYLIYYRDKRKAKMKKKAEKKYIIILFVAMLIIIAFVIINKIGIIAINNVNEAIMSSSEKNSFYDSYEHEASEESSLNEEKISQEQIDDNKTILTLQPAKMDYRRATIDDKNIEEKSLFGVAAFSDKVRYYHKIADKGFPYYFSSDEEWKEIYVSPVNTIACEMPYKDTLIICEFGSINSMDFAVRQLGKNINNILFEDKSWGFPNVYVVEDYLIISYAKGVGNDTKEAIQSLIVYDLNTNTYKTLETYTYENNPDGTMTGELLHVTGGFRGGFVFEVIHFTNEILNDDESGRAELYFYSFETEEIEKLPIHPKWKLGFVAGDRECIVTLDYTPPEPLMNTAIIYLLKDGEYESLKVPGIMPGNDIWHAYRITKDIIAVATLNELIFINTKDYTYESIKDIFFICVNGNIAGYINRKNKNKELELCIFED